MMKIDLTYKRGDKYVSAQECGLATKAAEMSTLGTCGLAAGIALGTAPALMLTAVGISMGLHGLGAHLDRKNREKQDNTPVSETTVTV